MLELKNGSRAAFELLVQRWDRKMLNYFSRCTYHRNEAEDLRQELFLRVYLRAETFKSDGNFQSWIYRIATNLVIDKISRKKTMRAENHVLIEDQKTEKALTVNSGVRTQVQSDNSPNWLNGHWRIFLPNRKLHWSCATLKNCGSMKSPRFWANRKAR